MGETNSQENVFVTGGLIIIRDDSYDNDNPELLGVEGTEKGWQACRHAYIDKYDDETGLTGTKVHFQDGIELQAAIVEPRNFMPRLHNVKRRRLTAEQRKKQRKSRLRHPDDRVSALRLIVDDKHELETFWNRSTRVIRECDWKHGDLHDVWRVRAIPTTEQREEPIKGKGLLPVDRPRYPGSPMTQLRETDKPETAGTDVPGGPQTRLGEEKAIATVLDEKPDPFDAKMRLMWLMNNEPLGKGGWICAGVTPKGAELGLRRRDAKRDHVAIPRPLYIAQIQDIVILTQDDVTLTTEPDKDRYTLANIRDDAHFHYDAEHDGRIFFSPLLRGVEVIGPVIQGDMRCDPDRANKDTDLNLESGQWRPQHPYAEGYKEGHNISADEDVEWPTVNSINEAELLGFEQVVELP